MGSEIFGDLLAIEPLSYIVSGSFRGIDGGICLCHYLINFLVPSYLQIRAVKVTLSNMVWVPNCKSELIPFS